MSGHNQILGLSLVLQGSIVYMIMGYIFNRLEAEITVLSFLLPDLLYQQQHTISYQARKSIGKLRVVISALYTQDELIQQNILTICSLILASNLLI